MRNPEQCRAANRNLAALASGEVRRRREETARLNKDRREMERRWAAEEKAERAEERRMTEEYRRLRRRCGELDVKLQNGTLTAEERGEYEELESECDKIAERLWPRY